MLFALAYTLAHAIEPGAARGHFDSDCACVEVAPGVHSPDRYSISWLPVARVDHLEHLELMNKDLLTAVFASEGRVSLAERDDVGPTVGRLQAVKPDLALIDNNSKNPCRHIEVSDIAPPPVLVALELTEDPRTDAAAVGKMLKTRSTGLGKCLGQGGEAHVALKVSGSGKVKASMVGSTLSAEQERCVLTNLAKIKAPVSQKAPGTLQFLLASGQR